MSHKKTILAGILLLTAAAALPAQQVVEEIVAIVNDDVITLSEFKQGYEERVQAARGQYQGEELDKALEFIKTHALDDMITDLLLLQLAKAENYNVTDQVKLVIENIKKANNIESDDDFRRALAQQGYDYDAWVGMMEQRILKDAVIRTEVGRKIVVDDAEVVDYYKKHADEFFIPEEYQLKAVYLTIEGKDPAALETRKAEIETKIKSGTAFDAVAEADSDEPLKEAKGSLGTFKSNELDKTLLAAVAPLKKGEMSPWVQAKNGWYLILLEDKKDGRTQTYEEAKNAIVEKLGTARQEAEIQKYLAAIKAKSYIKILKPNPLDDIR